MKNKENQADAAKKELDNAEQELNKNNPQKAEKHLDNAARIMGSPEDKKGNDQKDQKGQKDQKDQKGENKSDEEIKRPQSGQSQKPQKQEEKEGGIDRKQAEAILGQMGDDEKALRDTIKMHRRKNSKIPPVTKDW